MSQDLAGADLLIEHKNGEVFCGQPHSTSLRTPSMGRELSKFKTSHTGITRGDGSSQPRLVVTRILENDSEIQYKFRL
jgi:hypothetical protein